MSDAIIGDYPYSHEGVSHSLALCLSLSLGGEEKGALAQTLLC